MVPIIIAIVFSAGFVTLLLTICSAAAEMKLRDENQDP